MNDIAPVKISRWAYFWHLNDGKALPPENESFRKMLRCIPSMRDMLNLYYLQFKEKGD